MALPEELYDTPASRLDAFLAQRLQPSREWKEEVLEAVKAVEQFLREEPLEGACWPDQEVRVLKLVKVGSFGTGTALRGVAEVRLVAFLSGLRSFQEAARCHQAALRLLRGALWTCRDLLDLGLEGLEVAPGVPDALAFTIWTRWTAEPVTVTIVPAYRALGPSAPSSPPPPQVYERLAAACPDPGRLSPSFCELQRDFVKHRPTKLKGLLRLVKHWFLRAHHPGPGRPHPQRGGRVQMGHSGPEGLPVPEAGLLL
ncbi:2'-5'-oligoadenylate synthase-like protein isoform X3 [Pipistrellus kuhlii]|uniref:2'-5'-oligoadenylate synthetase like n=1 Tax=Pipistrellus kuhlii TaxID=59472 RepID=A0A7J7UGW0_PIPKU|nr:2'-5'-oligoadenylate synthase-like protein isoform X3 [Pipistrellus kuhlii]XP_045441324.1 2'-5'-oligoadenylate synthase-like protein isoform X3 [Pipistrellus kuhlii]KAF6312032.1 2'-5'-oligoadenylate synthetase like [Pipistrellus kuhlii]